MQSHQQSQSHQDTDNRESIICTFFLYFRPFSPQFSFDQNPPTSQLGDDTGRTETNPYFISANAYL